MCGILGTYERVITTEYVADFRRALGLLTHRGPDRTRCWHDGRIILGHTRLAIIDLSDAADQPMSDATGRYHVVFNGEIYNYLELRQELTAAGEVFRTDSDTEVILAAYRRWGPACLQRFNGMFAFVLYDARTHRLFAARDRYGVKPLYYAQADGGFTFASEMKALLALGAVARPNWPQVSRYLQGWGCDADSDTVYTGVTSVPAGHYAEVDGPHVRTTRWWDVLEQRVDVPRRFQDRVAVFRGLLTDAVRLRLRNDVPTGVCLSGGMDSSAVYGVARALRAAGQVRSATSGAAKEFRIFSLSHPGSPVDEYPWVEKCVRFWHDDEQVSIVRPQPDRLPALIDDLIWHQEAPVWSSSVLALHIMYAYVASQGTRVILEGHGGDELLGGYPYFAQAAVDTYAARGDWRRTWQAARCLADTRNPDIDEGGVPAWRVFLAKLPRAPHLRRWLKWQWRRVAGERSRTAAPATASYVTADIRSACQRLPVSVLPGLSPLGTELHTAFTQRILPIVLRVVDRATMAYSVESRAPLLDYRLVQFVFSLPDEDKVARETKYILRAATADVVPHAVRRRRAKLGFSIAEREWFDAPVVRDYLRDLCGSRAMRECGFIDTAALSAAVERCAHDGYTWHDTTRIWEALNIFLWHERFVRPGMPCDRGAVPRVEHATCMAVSG